RPSGWLVRHRAGQCGYGLILRPLRPTRQGAHRAAGRIGLERRPIDGAAQAAGGSRSPDPAAEHDEGDRSVRDSNAGRTVAGEPDLAESTSISTVTGSNATPAFSADQPAATWSS